MKLRFPDGITEESFLRDYWQKQPLFMPGALADYDFPLEPDELAGLACEEEIESRLVVGHDRSRWELHHGPFDESRFAHLPDSNWTLLVQDVDKYLPEVARLLQPFRFIPCWRFDDVMISYAAPGGSVGPHIDTYDVFLVQGMGRRRWQIQTRPSQEALIPDLPIRILAEFEPEQEWILKQGDLLYLPPGVAHWGTAEGECMSWSVGLRAPSHQEMLDSFARFLLERVPEGEHYRDPPLHPTDQPAAIPAAFVHHIFSELDRWLQDGQLRSRWFGSFMTEVKEHLVIEPAATPLSTKDLQHHLQRGGRLKRHPFARLAWSQTDSGESLLFVCGEVYETSGMTPGLLEKICTAEILDAHSLMPCLEDPPFLQTITELVNLGCLELEHERDEH